MASINDVYTSNATRLKAADLRGMEHEVTIDRSEVVQIKDGDHDKSMIELHFAGKEKTLLLNKTNAATIAGAYGDDYTQWGGKQLVLFPTKVDFGGNMVDAIRLRAVLPKAPEVSDNEFYESDESIPF